MSVETYCCRVLASTENPFLKVIYSNLSHGMFVFFGSYPPTAADSEGPQRARSRDCWPHRAGWSVAPAPGADSPMTTGTQSFQAETVWLCEKGERVLG